MRTLDWIQWLLEWGWTLQFKIPRLAEPRWEWRDPNGISGNEFCSADFDILPRAVEFHIMQNAIMQPTRGRS